MVEEWRDIDGYGGRYRVSNTGKVVSTNYNHTGQARELSYKRDRYGYMVVHIKCAGTDKWPTVHRLVAKSFIPNRHRYKTVNHIDGDKTNNTITNLEWMNNEDNLSAGHKEGLFKKAHEASKKRRKPVILINVITGAKKSFESLSAAGKYLGTNASSVSEALHQHKKTVLGHKVVMPCQR